MKRKPVNMQKSTTAKKILRRCWRIFRNSFLFIIGFLLSYFLSAYLLSRISVKAEKNTDADVAIFIKTNGDHTDIVVPLKNDQYDWIQEIKFSNTRLKDTSGAAYLALGWGDKGFYLETPEWSQLKFSVAFKAAFWLSSSAMHATFYGPLTESNSCKKILISRGQYARLISFISNSFEHDAQGHVMLISTDKNYGDADAFYEAKGKYNLFYTCNTWANNALKSCGQKPAYGQYLIRVYF